MLGVKRDDYDAAGALFYLTKEIDSASNSHLVHKNRCHDRK